MNAPLPLWVFILALGGAIAGAWATVLLVIRMTRIRTAKNLERDREIERQAFVGTLAGGLAHEIRNPLSAVAINLQLLKEEWSNPVSEREQKARKKIDILLRETQRLENVVHDFLRFASGHKLKLESVTLNSMLEELVDFIAPQAERRGIRFVKRLQPDLPSIQADANLVRQALFNLLANAQEAMPKGGELTLITAVADRDHAQITIQDSGIGIAPEHLPKIFNVYFSTKPGGTGLGLPTARKIIEEHQGQIKVESRPNRGTTFRILLPFLMNP